MKDGYYMFLDEFYNYGFFNEKDFKLNRILNIIGNIEKLSKLNYEDENIIKFIAEATEYYIFKRRTINDTQSEGGLDYPDKYKDYIPDRLKFRLVNGLYLNYVSVLSPDNYGLYNKVSKLNETVEKNDFYLYDDKSFENIKNFLSSYISLKKEFDDALLKEKESCLNLCNGKLFMIEEVIKEYFSYKRFSSVYNKLLNEKRAIITEYIYSEEFSRCSRKGNDEILNKHLEELWKNLVAKNKQNIKIFEYMNKRMLRLKKIKPKNMEPNEKEIFDKLEVVGDEEEFEDLYAKTYSIFIDHMHNDEKLKENIKTKKTLNIIKRKIDTKFKQVTSHLIESHQTTPKYIRNYLYSVLQRVIDDNSVSFDQRAIAELTLCDFSKDSRVINEAINGNNVVSENNIYIPRLDNKTYHRKLSYPLVELTFHRENVEVNDLTQIAKINGEPSIDYDKFIYQYISLDTYIKKATYIGKKFNNYNKTDSQDFSNSTLCLNYNGILLVETNGEYEIVSHETITMAGYDIPEADQIKSKTGAKEIEEYKKVITDNIVSLAGSLRDEDSPLNRVNVMKPINVRSF